MEIIKRSVVARELEGREGWRGRAQRIFRAVKMLCVIP